MTTHQLRTEWERIARTLAPDTADAIEQNAVDAGHDMDSGEYFAECIAEAIATNNEESAR